LLPEIIASVDPLKILQLDVESISYELIKPEAKFYEQSTEKNVTVKDAAVLMVSVEKGDTNETADRAFNEIKGFLGQMKRENVVIYPFAHLSSDLADPKSAMEIIQYMSKSFSNNFRVTNAPFGWNKKWSVVMKGHPMAEQLKTYSASGASNKPEKKEKEHKPNVDLSIVKKSVWSNLPPTDHRTIGEQLDLYSFQEVSPGMTYWHPNGYIVFKELMRYIREKLDEYGYQEIATPAFANVALWHMSGHWEKYRENMFIVEAEGQQFGLKPMNCPSTVMIFKSRKWSYRDLPVRLADFDKLYRKENSGSLTGLFRVMEMTQDDAHLFVRDDQVEGELTTLLTMIKEFYARFDLQYSAKLSTMPEKHLGDDELWKKATESLKNALNKNGITFEIKEGEGAFYGPKIDFDVKDSAGREWQCATVQLDYQQPERFNLEYTGSDGKEHRPVMIHRVIYGTLERFIGVMTEHYQGKFPVWLSPVQAVVVTISEDSKAYGEQVFEKIKKEGVRVGLDNSDKTLQYKIREATMQKVPYIIVLGKKEAEKGTITVRSRSGKQSMDVKPEDFVGKIKEEIANRSKDLSY
jgi:threonyl-tRNA synthetase